MCQNSRWDEGKKIWISSSMNEYAYTVSGTLSEDVYSWYDEYDVSWLKQFKEVYYYDPSVPYESLFVPFTYAEIFQEDGKLDTVFSYDWNAETDIWEKDQTYKLSYSDAGSMGGTSVPEEEGGIKIYPVPAGENLHLEIAPEILNDGSVVFLYNLQGALLMEVELRSLHTVVDVSALSSSSYFIMIQSGPVRYYRKLVKL